VLPTKNIIANYLGAAATVLAPMFALPWYLSELGPAQFGLLGFITTLQAILGLLDAGIGQALVREIAVRFDHTESGRFKTASLLFCFERIYWVFALSAALVVALLAHAISTHWLNLGDLPVETGRQAVYGAAAIFAAQFPGSVYRSALVGTQAQVTLNILVSGSAIVRHAVGVAVVVGWPTMLSYLTWHTIFTLFETLIRRRCAWSILQIKSTRVNCRIGELKQLWRSSASMSGAVLIGVLTVQMDRIVLSRMVSIEQFGYYTIAATLAVSLLQLIHPLTQAVLPRAIQLRRDPDALRVLSIKLAWMIALIVGLGGVVFIVEGSLLLHIWLHSAEAVAAVHPVLTVLLLGVALNAFYNVGYVNWLVRHKTHRILQVNALALLLSVAVIPLLVSRLGSIGAAFGWLAINLIGFVFSLGWIKRKKNDKSD
jgi:O-antigen/teichoic acid export membrane protein